MFRIFMGIMFGIYLEQRYALPNLVYNAKQADQYLRENYKLKKNDDSEKEDSEKDENTGDV